MSNAALFVEAVDTLITLIRAAFGWLIFLAVTGSILALAAIACGAWDVDVAWGWLWGRVRGSDGVDGTEAARPGPRERHRAQWASLTPDQQAERLAELDTDQPASKEV